MPILSNCHASSSSVYYLAIRYRLACLVSYVNTLQLSYCIVNLKRSGAGYLMRVKYQSEQQY